LVLVGLPARGKTYIARRLCQYLRFFHGAVCEVFNVGNYRRKMVGTNRMADFFDPRNADNMAQRLASTQATLDDMKAWIKANAGTGTVAVFDATNTTRARRVRYCELLSLPSPQAVFCAHAHTRLPFSDGTTLVCFVCVSCCLPVRCRACLRSF
jgi:6-phosphofructo-2-kinase/fructose-2,6-biphosphatase 2